MPKKSARASLVDARLEKRFASALEWTAAALIPPFHIYRHLKGAYRLRRFGALWRTFLMVNFATVTTVLFLVLLIYPGVGE